MKKTPAKKPKPIDVLEWSVALGGRLSGATWPLRRQAVANAVAWSNTFGSAYRVVRVRIQEVRRGK